MKKTMKLALTIALFSIASLAAASEAPDVEFHPIPGTSDLPFSQAVRVGNTLYLSGQIGLPPGTRELPEGIQAQTRQTMDNIKSTVERLGSSMTRVVKCTVFLADMAEWGEMNEVYVTYFPEHPPARSALGASGLALDARVEIECIAVVGDG